MATKNSSDNGVLIDGSFDWTRGVDSSKVTTLKSDLVPNGIGRDQLSWLQNASVRTAGILQRTGWQPLVKILDSGRWQGGFIYEPDGVNQALTSSCTANPTVTLKNLTDTIAVGSTQNWYAGSPIGHFQPWVIPPVGSTVVVTTDADFSSLVGTTISFSHPGNYLVTAATPACAAQPATIGVGFPYLVCSISGQIYAVLLQDPYTITNLSASFGLYNPIDAEMAFFCQGENYLVIQAGDYYTGPLAIPLGGTNSYGQVIAAGSTTLPLFWDGSTLRRSRGITTGAPTVQSGLNELPAATCMDYYGNRIWYAQARVISAGDMLGALSGTTINRRRDAILNVTENALCFSGDGFSIPTNAGNIRAIKHSSNLNAMLGQGQLYIFTRKAVYQLTVPTTRTDWINATTDNQPRMDVVQLVNGAVGDRCVVPVNGDLFYQSLEPAIRSFIRSQTSFGDGQWGNTPISQNEERALQYNDRSLMRFSSGIEFNNRILQAVLPTIATDGVNVVHQGILPLDFDIVTNLEEKKAPVWEGIWDGLQILELHSGDFGGQQRAFATAINEDLTINVWELSVSDKFQNGDERVTWGAEFPAFTWSTSGYEYRLKQLNGGELWIDKLYGTVDFDVYYRADAEPCWRHWFHHQICAARCEDLPDAITAYPCDPCREGYVFTVAFPEPLAVCNQMNVRPTTIGFQFQIKIMLKGWCRIRGLLLYALPKPKPQFQGIACPPNMTPGGMATLPNPFA